jgi:hypothetical protein
MIPLPQLGVEFVLGIGAALFAGNLWALLRPRVVRSKNGRPVPRPASIRRVTVNILIGAVVAVWALVTLIGRG